MSSWLGLLALNACLLDVPPGPDLGDCAAVPDGVYGYGEAGIGTCLSGPADLVFFQQDGATFLAVTNADPYRTFRSGSVLVLEWDSLVDEFLSPPPEVPETILMSDTNARALELLDDDNDDGDMANPYLGGFGYLPEHQAAIVSSRLTEGLTASATANGLLRVGKDELYVVDLSDMELPGGEMRLVDEIELEDDPFPVVVDDNTRRAFVGNLTDHSVSVLSTAGDADAIVTEIDVAPGPTTTLAPFLDADGSGSQAAVSTLVVQKPNGTEITEDAWTLAFIEGTVRAWVPTPINENIDGVARWSSGDARTWLPSAFGPDLTEGEVLEPFLEAGTDGSTRMYFAQSDGDIRLARPSITGAAGDWDIEDAPVLAGGFLGSPSTAPLPGEVGLYVDRRDTVGEPAEIVLATSLDGLTFSEEATVLRPPEGVSYEDPFVAYDTQIGRYRMWLTVRTGDVYTIATTQSDNGRDWDDLVTVMSDPDRALASPTVAPLEGRYGMWLSRDEGDRWDHVFSWSYDGVNWTEPELAIPGELLYDPATPPRLGVLVDRVGGWSITGADSGSIPLLLAAGTVPEPILGFDLSVANGQELDNTVVPGGMANLQLVPGSSVLDDAGNKLLYATADGAQTHKRLVLLREQGGSLLYQADISAGLGLPAGQFASDPVVVRDGAGYVLFFTLWQDGVGRLRRATSSDGLGFELEPGDLVPEDEIEFDSVEQRAHSLQLLGDDGIVQGGVMLWYTGYDGSQMRIGTLLADSPSGDFAREPTATTDWRLGPGLPGSFDDTHIKDPLIVEIEGATHLYYAGSDGFAWHLGHAVVEDDGTLSRLTDSVTGLGRASLSGMTRTFSAAGVESPVLWQQDAERVELLYSGWDSVVRRIGRASLRPGLPDAIFAEQRFPTSGDTLSFETTRGGPGAQVIELAQIVDDFTTTGFGMSAIALDEARGFLYVTSKLEGALFVLDVRDDSNGDFVDSNFLDVEALVVLDAGNAAVGARDVIVSPTRGLAYVTMRSPDGLAVIDLTRIPDDGLKEQIVLPPATILPLQSAGEDAGSTTVAVFSGGRSALTPDERLLLVPHFRGNGLSVFDLEMSAWGQEIAWLPNLGENPHVVKVSPDGRYAVVANYLGEVVEQSVSSTLAVIDVDPSSVRYLEVVAWLANR